VACIRSCLKSVLRYKYLILCAYHDTPYFYVSDDMRIRGYFSKPRGSANKKVWEILTYSYLKWKVEEKLQAHYIHPGRPVVSSSNISYLLNFSTLLSVQSALRTKQPPFRQIREAISYRVKRPEREADHSLVQRLRMSAANLQSLLAQGHILLLLSAQHFHDSKK